MIILWILLLGSLLVLFAFTVLACLMPKPSESLYAIGDMVELCTGELARVIADKRHPGLLAVQPDGTDFSFSIDNDGKCPGFPLRDIHRVIESVNVKA